MKKYINKENEAKFYYIYIYISLFLAVSSGNLVIQRVLEGKGISYVWTGGIVISLLMAISSTIKYKKASTKKNADLEREAK